MIRWWYNGDGDNDENNLDNDDDGDDDFDDDEISSLWEWSDELVMPVDATSAPPQILLHIITIPPMMIMTIILMMIMTMEMLIIICEEKLCNEST